MLSGRAVIPLLVLAGLVAVAGVIAVPTASAATVWSATLTVKEFGSVAGCDNSSSGHECSSLLDDDDFTYDGATLEITGLWEESAGNIVIEFSAAPSQATQALQLRVSSYRKLLSSRDSISQAGKRFTFADTGQILRDGQMRTVSLEERPANSPATGLPRVFPAAEGADILFADTWGVADGNGFPIKKDFIDVQWSYQWIRVDGDDATQTNIGVDSIQYQTVDADIGHLIKVRVSFGDRDEYGESRTSDTFGPIRGPAGPSRPAPTLVSNTGQPGSATATITGDYAMGFRLGTHGQGYEINSVSIHLAAVPSSLTVSLWIGGVPGLEYASDVTYKLFDFANPSSFKAGRNKFTAPAGAFAYQNVNYFVVLSGFGSSLSIKETTSDDEDAGGEAGAILFDDMGERGSVLRLAVEGSRRDSGILASTYAQPYALDDDNEPAVDQEIISVGDAVILRMAVGTADRFLIRGFSWYGDNTTPNGGGFLNPFDLKEGSTKLFRLHKSRDVAGISAWSAPRGATVAGNKTYDFVQFLSNSGSSKRRGSVLLRGFGPAAAGEDTPTAPGVTLSVAGDLDFPAAPYMAVLGEPLDAMVQNLGQADNSYVSAGGGTSKVLSQGFTTVSGTFGYRLRGIGVNIEGSNSGSTPQVPDGPASVSVAVHADSNGQPGAKLFDLVSPTDYAPGHSYFEAPPGTNLAPDTSYVLVWNHLGGTNHRLQQTGSDGQDPGGLTGFSIADAFYAGADLSSLTVDSGGNALEIAVYGEANGRSPFVPGGYPVTRSWLHIPEDENGEPVVEVGDQFRALFVTHHGREATSGDIDDYNGWVQGEAGQTYNHRVIRKAASQFRAVVCTEDDDARDNTGMTDSLGVPVHWLDGGWEEENRPTLVADTYDQFYGGEWMNHDKGAYVTGNSMRFEDNEAIWAGCLSSGVKHPKYPVGKTHMVVVGTPRDENLHPLGAVDAVDGYLAVETFDEIDGEEPRPVLKGIYAISPILTVVDQP